MNCKVDSRLGRPMSLQARKKISEALKGRPSPRKGMRATEETRRKLSLSHKGQIPSDKQRQIASEKMKRFLNY